MTSRSKPHNRMVVTVAVLAVCVATIGAQAATTLWSAPLKAAVASDLASIALALRGGSLAMGDFNGDGQMDAAVAGTYIGGVAVFAGGTQSWVKAGRWPVALAAGDFDADGDIDLAVANRNEAGVAILTNNGAGQFARTAFYATGDRPQAIVAADLDKDGDLDLIIANGAAGTVTVLANAAGVFSAAQTIPLPSLVDAQVSCEPAGLAVADLDGDAWPDVAVACGADDTVKLLANANGTLSPGAVLAAGPYPVAVAVADFNGDALPDLAVANSEGAMVTLLLAAPLGQYQIQEILLTTVPTVGPMPIDVLAIDVEGDGDMDLLAAGLTLANSGAGVFSIIQPSVVSAQVYEKATLPGTAGVFVGAYESITSYYASNLSLVRFDAAPAGEPVNPADINGDGAVDILDLLILADSWGLSAGEDGFNPQADFNGDGSVGILDLLVLADAWNR